MGGGGRIVTPLSKGGDERRGGDEFRESDVKLKIAGVGKLLRWSTKPPKNDFKKQVHKVSWRNGSQLLVRVVMSE